MITRAEIERLLALEAKVTRAPWNQYVNDDGTSGVHCDEGEGFVCELCDIEETAVLISESRNALRPLCLALLAALDVVKAAEHYRDCDRTLSLLALGTIKGEALEDAKQDMVDAIESLDKALAKFKQVCPDA